MPACFGRGSLDMNNTQEIDHLVIHNEDGAPLNPGIGVDIDALVAIGDVLAIEVYSSSAGVRSP